MMPERKDIFGLFRQKSASQQPPTEQPEVMESTLSFEEPTIETAVPVEQEQKTPTFEESYAHYYKGSREITTEGGQILRFSAYEIKQTDYWFASAFGLNAAVAGYSIWGVIPFAHSTFNKPTLMNSVILYKTETPQNQQEEL